MARVAALQFASGTDVDANLATCLRMIDKAQSSPTQLLVLPEFCNHISWYDDAEHARHVSLDLDGDFLAAIAARAARYECFIVINVTLRRGDGSLSVSSLMYNPAGELAATADKQTLMGHENIWFTRATQTSEVVDTPFGRLAMFPCRDGVTCETPRGLALRGAQLFCDSLNSFALDEASLHVPARAPENKVFLVAANKVGPLIPEHLLQEVSEHTHIPLEFLHGAGESQIVGPDGEILARGPRAAEAVVYADVELALADNKRRPDGTDLWAARRPTLYAPIVQPSAAPLCGNAAQSVGVACLAPLARGEAALTELTELVAGLPAATLLAVLPELFCHEDNVGADLPGAAARSGDAINHMREVCLTRPELRLCTSMVLATDTGYRLSAVLIGATGLEAIQPRLHACLNHAWSELGDTLQPVDLPWGRLGLICGDDVNFPELIKVAALQGVHAIAVPFRLQEPWEQLYGLPSRAAENRICVVASSRALGRYAGLIADLEEEFTLMTEWRQRRFDGYINCPLVTPQTPGEPVVTAIIRPGAACNKLMSEQTDLLLDRPWKLSGDLVDQGLAHG